MALVKFQRRPTRIAFPGFTASPMFPTFDDAENRMNRFIERALGDPFNAFAALPLPETIGWLPAMEIVESEKDLTVTAELAGLDEKDIDVSVEDGVLTIRGQKTDERKEEEDKKVYLYERSYGSFERSFALPSTVDPAKVTAEFTKGLLKVHLPKDIVVKPKGKKVEIKTG